MKVYISGKISGLEYSEVEKKFNDAQRLLEAKGFEVVNPLNNGLSKEHPWEQHLVRDIDMLLPCGAIYMLDNWDTSVGARIEYDVAVRMSKNIFFEKN